uniref:RING-type E3 ubiquitin transferase n=1 Tax=Timema cristinae TaxID=61476 RepID=A0A7R9CWD3_TIMCR|nr:unnamed protein product [Timema cristinae]
MSDGVRTTVETRYCFRHVSKGPRAPICSKCCDHPRRRCRACSCYLCGGKDDPEKQILCDECDQAYHLGCLDPPLVNLPEMDEWYCPECKNDENEIVRAGGKLKESKRKSMAASKTTSSKRDWGKGMACVGRTKVCTIVPPDHFGPVPGVEVGTSWMFRMQASEAGIHRPHVAGIHGREDRGAFSIVLSGGYEDDVDNGDEFWYTGSGGRDLSGNKRTAAQSSDQKLTRMNRALALNCNAPINEQKGSESKDWKKGKPVRVIRSSKLAKHSTYAPSKGNRAACDPFLKCKLAFCKTIADECQPFLQRFQTSKPMTPYLFEAVEKLLRYLMNRCVKPDLMKCTGPKLLSIDTKKSENLILSKNIDIGFATKRLLGETAITVTERQKLEFIHECRSMLTTMIAKLQEKSPLKQKAVRGLSSLDPCVIQHSPQLAQKRFSFLLEELNHANIINDVLAENAKKEYLHFCNLKKSELQEIFRPCDQFSDEVGLDTIYGSFLIGEANYKHLWEVIKICLVLSHGNATVEGGFSVNKSLLVENMHEKTVIAQRHIHDEIQEAGGIKNIHISKKMLDYVRGARKRYHEYLEMKKQEKSEKDKKKAEKRKLDIQVKDLEGERKKLMMATEEKREAIDVELQELKKKQASLY